MYQNYFGLKESPFSISVNPRFLFMSARHRDALAHLLYGVGSGGGFILLTGEVGTGKTTINRALLAQLPDNADLAIVLNPALSAVELLATVCDEFAIDYPGDSASLKTLTDALHQFLLANFARGRKTVLMIDEAQHLGFDVLEQIRLLTNLETDEEKLLQIILIGQPELAEKLARPELRQLNQRITARYNLEPLSRHETGAYIKHRLSIAGLPEGHELFASAAVGEVHRQTGGVPRLINLVCERVLLGAYGKEQRRISRQLVKSAANEVLGLSRAEGRSGWSPAKVALGVTASIALAASLGFLLSHFYQQPADGVSPGRTDISATMTAGKEADFATSGREFLVANDLANRWLWRLSFDEPVDPAVCRAEASLPIKCLRESSDTWDSLITLNRAVALEARTADKFSASILVVAFADRSAWVMTAQGLRETPLMALAEHWTGGYRFLWRAPRGWNQPLQQGDTGLAVAEVAKLFARLDNQEEPIAFESFTPLLEERVKLFQQARGLIADGVVGEETLLALSEALGDTLLPVDRLQRAERLRDFE
jgi:general secretion pathway protein A